MSTDNKIHFQHFWSIQPISTQLGLEHYNNNQFLLLSSMIKFIYTALLHQVTQCLQGLRHFETESNKIVL